MANKVKKNVKRLNRQSSVVDKNVLRLKPQSILSMSAFPNLEYTQANSLLLSHTCGQTDTKGSNSRAYLDDYVGSWGVLVGTLFNVRVVGGKYYGLVHSPIFRELQGLKGNAKIDSSFYKTLRSIKNYDGFFPLGDHLWVNLSDMGYISPKDGLYLCLGTTLQMVVRLGYYKGNTLSKQRYKVGVDSAYLFSSFRACSLNNKTKKVIGQGRGSAGFVVGSKSTVRIFDMVSDRYNLSIGRISSVGFEPNSLDSLGYCFADFNDRYFKLINGDIVSFEVYSEFFLELAKLAFVFEVLLDKSYKFAITRKNAGYELTERSGNSFVFLSYVKHILSLNNPLIYRTEEFDVFYREFLYNDFLDFARKDYEAYLVQKSS